MIEKPVHIMDIMPVCLELAGAAYPRTYKGHTLDPLDGRSFLPLLSNGEYDWDRLLFWEHEGNRAVRQGDWKLVAFNKKKWELYNLTDGPYETQNLVSLHPEKAEQLCKLYEKWAEEHGVQPWPLKKKK